MTGKPLLFLSAYLSSRRRFFLAAAAVVCFGLLVYLAVSVHGLASSLREGVRDTRETVDLLKRNVSLLAGDSEELRFALGLPARNYPPLEPEEEPAGGSGDAGKAAENVLFYRAVESLIAHAGRLGREKKFLEIMESPDIASFIRKNAFQLKKTPDGAVLEKNRNPYLFFGFGKNPATYEVRSFSGASFSFDSASPELAAFLAGEAGRLAAHFAALPKKALRLQEFLRRPAVLEKLAASGFVLETPSDGPDALVYRITMKVERDVPKLTIGLDKKTGSFFIGEKSVDDAGLESGFAGAVAGIDTRTTEELKVAEVAGQIVRLSEDDGFRSYLKSKNLSLSTTSREDSDYVYFDFVSPAGGRFGALGIQKVHGEIYIFDADDVSLGSLKTFGLAEEAKKKREIPETLTALPGRRDPFSRTFLVVGAHEKMTDTIILATVNEKRNDISLISLPRDLFFRGRKVNTLYVRYGADRFVREVAAMTGLPVEKYIIIDMFAFIDAINILGGIDITLAEDLVDPTYRVRDGGRWTTLFYPAGSHHVNGVEALRIARSRHFTSDFGRAQRQQDLVFAIKDKLVGLGLKDFGKIYGLMQTLVKYVDTNLSPLEMVNYFLKYGEAKIASRNVIDTDNMLYHSYTNLKHLNLQEEEVEETFDKGAYILLPLEDDWDAFRSYIRLLIEGAAA